MTLLIRSDGDFLDAISLIKEMLEKITSKPSLKHLGILMITFGIASYALFRFESEITSILSQPTRFLNSRTIYKASDVSIFFENLGDVGKRWYTGYLLLELTFVIPSSLLFSAFVYSIANPIATAEKNLDQRIRSQLDLSSKRHALSYPAEYLYLFPILLSSFEIIHNLFLLVSLGLHLRGFAFEFEIVANLAGQITSVKSASSRFLMSGTAVTLVVSIVRLLIQGLKMGDAMIAFKQPELPSLPKGLVPAADFIKAENEAKKASKGKKKKIS